MIPVSDTCVCYLCVIPVCVISVCVIYVRVGKRDGVCVGVKWLLSGLDKVWDGEGERKACVHVCGHNY